MDALSYIGLIYLGVFFFMGFIWIKDDMRPKVVCKQCKHISKYTEDCKKNPKINYTTGAEEMRSCFMKNAWGKCYDYEDIEEEVPKRDINNPAPTEPRPDIVPQSQKPDKSRIIY